MCGHSELLEEELLSSAAEECPFSERGVGSACVGSWSEAGGEALVSGRS